MIHIRKIVNSIFNSITYILYKEGFDKAWLVDIGDIKPIEAFCEEKQLTIEGVFITHGHFDHIYGLQSLMKLFPHCLIYTTEYGKQSLASDKLNLSKYHEISMSYEGKNVIVVHDGDTLSLFEKQTQLFFFETPGHNPGCLTMMVDGFLFTGDSYIPGMVTNTRLPQSDKTKALLSLERIRELSEGKLILPGHQVSEHL